MVDNICDESRQVGGELPFTTQPHVHLIRWVADHNERNEFVDKQKSRSSNFKTIFLPTGRGISCRECTLQGGYL